MGVDKMGVDEMGGNLTKTYSTALGMSSKRANDPP